MTHGELRDIRRAAVADLDDLIGDGHALLRTRGDRRRDQRVQRVRAGVQRLAQHLTGEQGGQAVSVPREGLALLVKALLLRGEHAHAVAGVDVRFRQMGERIVLRQRKGRRDDQHMPALGQVFERGEAVCPVQRKAFRAVQRGLAAVVHKAAGVHRVRQQAAHRIARGAEQHRPRPGGYAALVKQAADQGGSHIIHTENPSVPYGQYAPNINTDLLYIRPM